MDGTTKKKLNCSLNQIFGPTNQQTTLNLKEAQHPKGQV